MIRKQIPYWSLVSALVLLLGTLGCGGGGEFGVASAGGTVTLNGQPVPDLMIAFTPQTPADGSNPGKSASGRTDAQGKFTLSTYDTDDGAIVGSHQVTIYLDATDPTPPGRLPADPFILEVKSGSNNFDIELTP